MDPGADFKLVDRICGWVYPDDTMSPKPTDPAAKTQGAPASAAPAGERPKTDPKNSPRPRKAPKPRPIARPKGDGSGDKGSAGEEGEVGTRLARVISRSGLTSRREAEAWIQAGRAEVNGEVVWHPGHPVVPGDTIRVDGKALPPDPPLVYFLLYKTKGTITGRNDPQGRTSVLEVCESLPHRVEPVGRLDFNTEGALLLTNDGDLAHILTHPSSQIPKRYLAKVWKTPTEKTLERLRRGVQLDDGRSGPALVRVVESTDAGNCWLEITVTEGRNHLVRRMLEAVGHPCNKLRRESFATISLRDMERGQLRPLTGEELARLRDIAEGVDPSRAGQTFRYKKGFARPKPEANKPLSQKKASRKAAGRRSLSGGTVSAAGKPGGKTPSGKTPGGKSPGGKTPGDKTLAGPAGRATKAGGTKPGGGKAGGGGRSGE